MNSGKQTLFELTLASLGGGPIGELFAVDNWGNFDVSNHHSKFAVGLQQPSNPTDDSFDELPCGGRTVDNVVRLLVDSGQLLGYGSPRFSSAFQLAGC